jgi:hypothetical protein
MGPPDWIGRFMDTRHDLGIVIKKKISVPLLGI